MVYQIKTLPLRKMKDLILNIEVTRSVLSEDRTENSTFMTSLDIIQEVMNVPMCALTSLLRSNGYDSIDDTSSFCIDEKKLEIFALAYERKIRSYFLSSLRNINELNQKELSSFEKFVELFKNKELKRKPSKWSDIDTELLRKAFIEKVKNKTPLRLGYGLTGLYSIILNKLEPIRKSYLTLDKLLLQVASSKTMYEGYYDNNFLLEDTVLDDVAHSYYYVARSTCVKQEWHVCSLIRNIYKAARYHIFSSDTDEENVQNSSFVVF